MKFIGKWLSRRSVIGLALIASGLVWTGQVRSVKAAEEISAVLGPSFEQQVRPFLKQNCVRCHNENAALSGVRVDHLDAGLEDRHLKLWEHIQKRISDQSMPPKGQPQPAAADRQQAVAWIAKALDLARSRPTPKNGVTRRLTVAQYRNTLRELLLLEDDLTEVIPPDALSKDGFLNNKDTQQLSPLLLEAYLDIAGEALNRSMVDPAAKPSIQNFRMDLGASVNPNPFPEPLILGANSLLLDNQDFAVTQLAPTKPFTFEPFFMQTKYRFIEGYAGNDTVRGWREYDSIYHSVFACMRGSRGYPKGTPYSTAPEGLLLRPAIPNDEMFDADGTYGPKANFKISLRELPEHGRFRVTVTAAKYNDGLLLDKTDTPAVGTAVVAQQPTARQTVQIPQAGVYQVDVYTAKRRTPRMDVPLSRLSVGLAGAWRLNGTAGVGARLEGATRYVLSPFGRAVSLTGEKAGVLIPRTEAMNVGEGDFTVSAWIRPRKLQRAGIVSLGAYSWTHGWFLDMPDDKGALRLETTAPDTQSNGTVTSPRGMLRANAWQHVAAVVRRGKNETRLYVNGYAVAKGTINGANLDNPKMNLQLGRIGTAQPFNGELDEVRLYRRALTEGELQGLVQPGLRFAQPPPETPPEVTLQLNGRQLTATLHQPAFAAVRLDAGPLVVEASHNGVTELDRIVLTPLESGNDVAQRFMASEKRSPRLGVHLGLRRDCGSTFARVGTVRTVNGTAHERFVFEGAIRNYPSPDVEKDNVNYLAGIREIAIRSEYTDGRDMPRLAIKSVEFEGPYYDEWPPKSHRNIFVDFDRKDDQKAYARHIIRNFATRAYRRPVTSQEEQTLMAVFDKSFQRSGKFQDSVKDALQVVLTSPQFLFLVEQSSTPGPEPLDDYELASKLSYFLWNGPPDKKTLELASAGTLAKHLDAEVDRMVSDRRFGEFVREFAQQWLSLDKFSVLEPDRARYPALTRDARTHLRQEPIEFLHYLIRENLPVRNLIDSDFVVANEAVATYYDLGEKTESGFQFVAIPHGRRELGGVLTQAAIMAGLSDGRESNPVKRGAWLARKIVAEPPDDPPPNVPTLPEDTQKLTLRQRIEKHRSQPGCVQCHLKIDPWGVAFEEFDAGGRLKKEAADARSILPDSTQVNGIQDLKRYLGDDRIDQVAFSVLKHLATYATGRSLTYYETGQLKKDALQLRAGGYRMKDMVRFVVTHKSFLEK